MKFYLFLILATALTAYTGIAISGAQQSKVPSELWQKVKEKGVVSVIVDLNVDKWTSKKLSPEANLAQRERIAEVQRLVLSELAGTRYKINRQFEIVPALAMEVGRDALAALEHSSFVRKISEDAKLSPSRERIKVLGTPEKEKDTSNTNR